MREWKLNKIVFFFFCLIFLSFNQRVQSQQADYWIFGYKGGLHFNPLFNKPQFTNSNISRVCWDGLNLYPSSFSASISDCEGKLLFYTNVSVVFNRNHDTMLNGAMCEYGSQEMYGTPTILERKDSVGKFLLINTVLGPKNGLVATLIDMNLDNGLGGVYAKDILINDSLFGRFAVKQHPNGIDYWVVFRPVGSFFVALQLSPSGTIVNRVESTDISGSYAPSPGYSTGEADRCVKFSNNSKMIAVNNLNYGGFSSYLYQFNPSTGKISQPKPLTQPSWHISTNYIQFEFSPNDSFLYASILGPINSSGLTAGRIFQLPTYLNNPTFSYHTFLIDRKKENHGIQLAPDGRIYFINPGDSSFGVILNPNRPGTQAELMETYIKFPFRLYLVLPNISTPFKQLDFRHNAESGQCVDTFTAQIQGDLVEYSRYRIEWGDGDSLILDSNYQSESIPHFYQSEGVYPIRLTAWTKGCEAILVRMDTVSIRIRPSGQDTITELRSLCGADLLQVFTNSIHTDSIAWRAVSLSDTIPWHTGKPVAGIYADSALFTDTNTYHFSIYRFKNNGCFVTNSATYTPSIEPLPQTDFVEPADTLYCIPHQLIYPNQSSNASFSYVYLNGEELSKTSPDTFQHLLESAGSFQPLFISGNADGCRDSLFGQTIHILAKPELSYTVYLDSTCDSSGFRISDKSLNADSIQLHVESIDFTQIFSGTLPVNASIQHNDTGNGSYLITYTGINAACRSDSVFSLIATKKKVPSTLISGVLEEYCMPAEFNIIDAAADKEASSYKVFLDGNLLANGLNSISLNPGSYNLMVVELFANNCQSDDSVQINVHESPQMQIQMDTLSDCSGFHVSLQPAERTGLDSIFIQWGTSSVFRYPIDSFDPSLKWTFPHSDSSVTHSFHWIPVTMHACYDTSDYFVQQQAYGRLASPNIKRISVVDSNSVLLRWDYPEGTETLEFFVKDTNGWYSVQFGTTETEKIIEPFMPAEGPVSIKIKALDSCGVHSDNSKTHTSIWLQSLANGDVSQLNWTDYQGWEAGNLQLDLRQEDGTWKTIVSKLANGNIYTDPSFSEALMDDYCYRIKASKSGEDSLYTLSNVSCVPQMPILLIPNAFSPNGDGLNDEFSAYSLSNTAIQMVIYNRWGEKIYTEDSKSPSWNGQYEGQPAEAGVYMYMITVLTNEGRKNTFKGVFHLIR